MLCRRNPICHTFDSIDVIKMREMRGEVGKITSKKGMDNPSFLMTSQESKVYLCISITIYLIVLVIYIIKKEIG